MINSLVIGLGVIGKVHISAITSLKNAKLIAVCDSDPSKKELVPQSSAFYTNLDEILDREKINAAHICLPHFLHYPIAKKAAEAGVNIFAEKPLAMNAKEGEEYCKLEKQYGVKICLCLQNRLNTTTETLIAKLRSGEYGKVTGVRGSVAWYRSKEYYKEAPWRGIMSEAGGGCMINQAIHTMDLMQYFAGSPIISVKGNIGQVLDYGIEVEDTATGHIIFANGARGLFTASIANFRDEQVEISVQTEKADFILRDRKLSMITQNPADNQPVEQIIASDSANFAGKQVYGSSHVKLIDKFYSALETNGNDYIHPDEGMPSIRMIDAIRESSKTSKTIYF